MLFGFIIKFIGTIMDLCLPWILAYMIDTVIPQGRKNSIYLWGFAMLVCSVLALTFNVIAKPHGVQGSAGYNRDIAP